MPSPWVWDDRSKRYRNTESGRFISQRTAIKLRDAYTAGKVADADRLSRRLVNRQVSVQEWTLEMRRQIKDAYVNQYMLARGGRNNMTQEDWGRVGGLIHGQYHYLNGFARDIDQGKLSEGQIRTRCWTNIQATAGLYVAQTANAISTTRSWRTTGRLPGCWARRNTARIVKISLKNGHHWWYRSNERV
jgi:hypothetical protein